MTASGCSALFGDEFSGYTPRSDDGKASTPGSGGSRRGAGAHDSGIVDAWSGGSAAAPSNGKPGQGGAGGLSESGADSASGGHGATGAGSGGTAPGVGGTGGHIPDA